MTACVWSRDAGSSLPYSAGLASGGGGAAVDAAALAAALFSTMRTAMIEPS
jgi:hypothetical protein